MWLWHADIQYGFEAVIVFQLDWLDPNAWYQIENATQRAQDLEGTGSVACIETHQIQEPCCHMPTEFGIRSWPDGTRYAKLRSWRLGLLPRR